METTQDSAVEKGSQKAKAASEKAKKISELRDQLKAKTKAMLQAVKDHAADVARIAAEHREAEARFQGARANDIKPLEAEKQQQLAVHRAERDSARDRAKTARDAANKEAQRVFDEAVKLADQALEKAAEVARQKFNNKAQALYDKYQRDHALMVKNQEEAVKSAADKHDHDKAALAKEIAALEKELAGLE